MHAGSGVCFVVVTLCCILAFIVRLFSVVKYESVIHEFDPYFNYRSTLRAARHGVPDFMEWFDDRSWYPLGRHVGHTVYPGLMVTATTIYHGLHFLGFPVDVRTVCVGIAPLFGSLTSLVTFLFTRHVWDEGAGLLAAALIAIAPGYTQRSVAGSYDNECVAIFAMVLTFYMFVKAVDSGGTGWSTAAAITYFYMVACWGGYIYVATLIPLYCFTLVVLGRGTDRLYVAYSIWYSVGTLLAMQISFVGFGALTSSTHYASHVVFILIQANAAVRILRQTLPLHVYHRFLFTCFTLGGLLFIVGVTTVIVSGYFGSEEGSGRYTTRFLALIDPQADTIPIISSVSEHQPSSWSAFFFDLHFLMLLVPVGLYYCLVRFTDGTIFVVLYGSTCVYFSAIMIRLIPVLTPVACMLGAIALSVTFNALFHARRTAHRALEGVVGAGGELTWTLYSGWLLLMLCGLLLLLVFFVVHSTWVTYEAYSNPSIVMYMGMGPKHRRQMLDDFREGYRWLSQNTEPDAKIASWWDYGYQIAAMANRTTIVDNNTWNNTHIATIGRIMASSEEDALPLLRQLDVDYLLVVFGGYVGYGSDDINKFGWMIRISSGVYPKYVKERAFGNLGVGSEATATMLNSLMYKMCYHRFGQADPPMGKGKGQDMLRGTLGRPKFGLHVVEEAYTSTNWMVRIYRVKKDNNRGPTTL